MQKKNKTYPLALTIAGSDSGGSAGIQADLRTFSSFGVFGTSAITAVTAQNHFKIFQIDPVTPESLNRQLEAVMETISISAIKIGMIPNLESAEIIFSHMKKISNDIPIVLDPVMSSSSGTTLMSSNSMNFIKKKILPLTQWITPNIQEAEYMLNIKLLNEKDVINASVELSNIYNCSTIITGGDSHDNRANDIISTNNSVFKISSEKIESPSNATNSFSHGTGCTFSSAITAALALGMYWKDSLIAAKAFVLGSLNESVFIAPNISAMYPPASSYRNKINFSKIH